MLGIPIRTGNVRHGVGMPPGGDSLRMHFVSLLFSSEVFADRSRAIKENLAVAGDFPEILR
jgi:hypothetical protein